MAMKARVSAAMLALALSMAAYGSAALGADERAVQDMLTKSEMVRPDGTVTRTDFIKLMEKRFDAMDKGRKGALSVREVAKLMDPRDFNP
jgi:hypothetical protein